MQITTVVTGQDELLITLTTQATSNAQGTRDPLAGVFHVTATTCALARVRRWHDENTPLRAYLSHDGAIMLADPALGGNAPATTHHHHLAHPQTANPPEPAASGKHMTTTSRPAGENEDGDVAHGGW